MEPIIRLDNVHHVYGADSNNPVKALDGIDLSIYPGEYVAILGHNGSGKSTLARHMNGLLAPTRGEVWIKQWNTRNLDELIDIRSTVGMVFQNPDNQIVATVVEEDVAFGPENLALPRDEIMRRVNWSLDLVGLADQRHRAPHLLSGGQKQRVCIAGILAMKPEVLVLDESTAMLDPLGRKQVLETVRRLNHEEGTTVVAITHYMEEAIHADRIVAMDEGRIALEGSPKEIFRQPEHLHSLKLDVPQVTQLAQALNRHLHDFPPDILNADEMVQTIRARLPEQSAHNATNLQAGPQQERADQRAPDSSPLLEAHHLVHYYMVDTPLEVQAISDVNLAVHEGEIVGIIGHTGSGKSTVIQHFNGLLRPHGGKMFVLRHDMGSDEVDVSTIRRQIGLLFQAPEAQLFERYVGDDIAFGPRKLSLSREEIRDRVRRSMKAVELDFDLFKDRMTFTLSGGEKRRAALAGVLALQPDVLVLDEPTAGLDPVGREHLLHVIRGLHNEGVTLVIVSHNMEELARICDYLYVISEGKTVMDGLPAQIFSQIARMRQLHLDVPAVTDVMARLAAENTIGPAEPVYTVDQAVSALLPRLASPDGSEREHCPVH